MMNEVNADVWVITENQCNFSLGEEFICIVSSEKGEDQKNTHRWVSIWARNAVNACPLPVRDPSRTACGLIQFTGGSTLVVYGTVLPWLGSIWKHKSSKGGVAYIAALEEQKKDWTELRQNYPQAILCVAGDFNQDLRESGHYYGSKIQRTALWEALAQTQLVCYTAGDVDPVAKRKLGSFNIDHICLGGLPPRASVSSEAWPGEQKGLRVSDHYGVKVELSFTKEDF